MTDNTKSNALDGATLTSAQAEALREHLATRSEDPELDPDPEVNLAAFDEECKFDDWADAALGKLRCSERLPGCLDVQLASEVPDGGTYKRDDGGAAYICGACWMRVDGACS